ncbi:hypothetical protein [Phenylobacterium sp.]|uniref:hypothetical protein n=1 Tax=Phenylobacterium sp. TaxID=1871053 RepID=UPI0039833B01
MTLHLDEIDTDQPVAPLVQWMERPPLRMGASGVSATAASAFFLGAATAVATLALMHWLGPRREAPPWRWGQTRH